MNVKMKTLAAGPNGIKHAGVVYPVSDEEGAALIHGKFAIEHAVIKHAHFEAEKEEAIIEPEEVAVKGKALTDEEKPVVDDPEASDAVKIEIKSPWGQGVSK